jgi:hypothetical protein
VKSELVKPTHLARRAVVYIRQSTPHQVESNQESLRLQYALRQRAHELGWHEADIDVIDADLGLSGASAAQRSGLRRRTACHTSPLHVIGIDDWAWKRGQRYGSIICDLEQRRIVDLLPDREPATVEAWLSRHPEIAVISRDRGGGYGRAATRAASRPYRSPIAGTLWRTPAPLSWKWLDDRCEPFAKLWGPP